MPLKLVDSSHAVQLVAEGGDFRADRRAGVGVVRVVAGLDSKVTHALQDGVNLGQGAFSGLDDR